MSQWLSGEEDLLHTHRMRALCDAVVVGVNTVLNDDPQLTVRRCTGAHPVRVVIDPERRLDGSQRIFRDGAAPTLVLAAADRARAGETLGQAEVVPVPRGEWGLDPHEIRRILARRGLAVALHRRRRHHRLALSRRARARPSPDHGGAAHPRLGTAGHPAAGDHRSAATGLRPSTRRFVLGDDVMIECDFHDPRARI